MQFDRAFWNTRYATQQTGWDLGAPSPPLKRYIDTLTDRHLRILVPGCGNAYEAQYLHEQGFVNVYVLDIAPLAVEGFSSRIPDFPKEHIICDDFFTHVGIYDVILEQTFFCALSPSLRSAYAQQIHKLLTSKGILAGLLFGAPMNADHPPFGGNALEYQDYFAPLFDIISMKPCMYSIPPRLGSELWIEMRKKAHLPSV